jgi:subtilisin family serine protease
LSGHYFFVITNMAIYLLKSRSNPAQSLSLTSTKFTAASRTKQIVEITNTWKEDSDYQKVRDWVRDAQARGVLKALSNLNDPDIAGTIIVDIPEKAVDQMQNALSGVEILADRPLDLIQPHRIKASLKNQIGEEDLWHLENIGLCTARLQTSGFTGTNFTIAVLDTGIDGTHPELQGKVTESYSLDIRRVRTLGEVDPLDQAEDSDGHGTHVAGLICGRKVGVAPEVKLINAVLLPSPGMGPVGFFSNFELAMRFLSKRTDIDIINISAGISGSSYLKVMDNYLETLLAVGILPVCAVGNEGRNRTRSPGNCRSAISVGATNRGERVAAFSSFGTIELDHHQYNVPSLVAPGEAVYSSVVGGHYEAWDGTSMAAPIVSGIAALILEQYPDITVLQLIEELISRCQPIQNDETARQGAGVIKVI